MTRRRAALHAILLGGCIAATLDILAAFALAARHGGTPARILKSIASGVLGRDAFDGGAATAALGLALHFAILIVAAALYFIASRRLRPLALQPLRFGALYGVAVWAFMHGIVLPLSAVPFQLELRPGAVALQLAIHVACVGWPVAWAVHRDAMRVARCTPAGAMPTVRERLGPVT